MQWNIEASERQLAAQLTARTSGLSRPASLESMGSKMRFGIVAAALLITFAAQAEPTGPRVNVIELRPYAGGNAYLRVSSSEFCGTEVFAIALNEPGGKEIFATALTALTTGKKIAVEIPSGTGCTGWGTRVQSIYIFP